VAIWTRTEATSKATRRTSTARPLLVAYGLGALAFLGICGVQALGSVDVWQDPQVTTDQAFYLGLGSNLGVILWGATVSILLFTWFALGPGPVRAHAGRGLLAAAGLTTVLLADDMLLLHDRVFRYEWRIPEHQTLVIYGVIGLACLMAAFRVIRESPDRVLFISVVVLFALALVLDFIDETDTTLTGSGALEDGAEFLGVIGWLAFWSRTCNRLIASTRARVPAGDVDIDLTR
jgi:hypothetical protein